MKLLKYIAVLRLLLSTVDMYIYTDMNKQNEQEMPSLRPLLRKLHNL